MGRPDGPGVSWRAWTLADIVVTEYGRRASNLSERAGAFQWNPRSGASASSATTANPPFGTACRSGGAQEKNCRRTASGSIHIPVPIEADQPSVADDSVRYEPAGRRVLCRRFFYWALKRPPRNMA